MFLKKGQQCDIIEGMVTDRNLKPKEDKVGKTETAEECINKVKKDKPAAKGMSWNPELEANLPESKECFATFNVTGLDEIDTTKRCYFCNFKGKKSTD